MYKFEICLTVASATEFTHTHSIALHNSSASLDTQQIPIEADDTAVPVGILTKPLQVVPCCPSLLLTWNWLASAWS
jgi:hypothetical protein